jgi:hypothetical protein
MLDWRNESNSTDYVFTVNQEGYTVADVRHRFHTTSAQTWRPRDYRHALGVSAQVAVAGVGQTMAAATLEEVLASILFSKGKP